MLKVVMLIFILGYMFHGNETAVLEKFSQSIEEILEINLTDEEKRLFRYTFSVHMDWGEQRKTWQEDPMTKGAAQAFGKTKMPFGKFENKLINDVPLDYLEWLADSVSPFNRQIRRYLMSDYVKEERKYEDD